MGLRFWVAGILGSANLLGAGTTGDAVLSLLRSECSPCHAEPARTSGFSIASVASVMAGGTRRGPAVRPGLPGASPLLQVLRGDLTPRMPPAAPLAGNKIALIEKWIEGLKPAAATARPIGNYWAFRKPLRSPLPAVRNSGWVRNPVDLFTLQPLEEKGLAPAGEASRSVLIRRLYFDLLGLPPTPEEVKAFVENPSAGAYEELVDRLLGSPRYGERWARHWLDLARYADTNGYEGDAEYPHAWRYRDYVVDAFNSDKPYKEFIVDQIAGDEIQPVMSAGGLPPPEPEKVVALTFLRLAPFTEPRGEESRDILLSEMVSTVSSVFLGLTVGCAKCHDHKYDSVPTKDFYRMKAFFSSVYIAAALPGDSQQLGGPQPAEFYRAGEKEQRDRQRGAFKQELEKVEAEFLSFYTPLVDRLAAAWTREKPNDPRKPALRDLERAIDPANNNALGPAKTDLIFSTQQRQTFSQFSERIRRLKNGMVRLEPLAMSLRNADDPPYGPSVPATYVLLRGEHDHRGEAVEAGFLSAITGNSEAAAIPLDRYKRHPNRSRRLTLARWIADPENPLTARVMVNRIWQHHFGRGIVATPSDFGRNGSAPTHPALLDWLATEFVAKNWSLKAIHRLIVTSSTYRQASRNPNRKAAEVDPDNRLLWRFPRVRLEGEVIRDSVLAASGRLHLDAGGPPVYPPLPKGLDEEQKVQSINTWEMTEGPAAQKRSIYVFQRRSLSLPLLETFDAPVLNASCDRRRTSVTALQPLAMYDGEFVNTEARYFALRVRQEAGPDHREQVQRAFQIAFGRTPSASEQKQVDSFVGALRPQDDWLVGVCRVLLNSNEFLYID